ncbi:uncharacterized protein [Acropora muricata]|uniref:uncharacterized protein n=1 Tax=Acropora muricata TaxID=159855 RepID=UPI0034E5A563
MLIHYSLLVFHALSFVQGLSRVIETGLRATNFAKTIQGKKLTGNVIKEVAVTSVLNCQIECAKESRCLSYNFKATTSKAPSTCYLSDSDRFRSLTNFSKDEEVLYGGIQSTCEEDDTYCGNTEVCIPDYENHKQHCRCRDGYFGNPCIGYEALGCFRESHPFAIPKLIVNFRGGIDWHDMTKHVRACAEKVHSHGYHVFGIRFYGECWSGVDSGYDRYGPSESCLSGVGKDWSHFVYRIKS